MADYSPSSKKEISMAVEKGREQYVVPIGPGRMLGRLGRIVIFTFTGGFLYPNVFIEGMDCTKIQDAMQGDLYDKKK
jgi:hypothetical protein